MSDESLQNQDVDLQGNLIHHLNLELTHHWIELFKIFKNLYIFAKLCLQCKILGFMGQISQQLYTLTEYCHPHRVDSLAKLQKTDAGQRIQFLT